MLNCSCASPAEAEAEGAAVKNSLVWEKLEKRFLVLLASSAASVILASIKFRYQGHHRWARCTAKCYQLASSHVQYTALR